MMKQLTLLLLIGLALMLVVAGCGGGSSTGSSALTAAPTVTIKWPARSRLIPAAAESIKITLTDALGAVQEQIVNRPDDGTQSSVSFSCVPEGMVTVSAVAYPKINAQGVPLAKGICQQNGVAGQPLLLSLTMYSTIDHLVVQPDNLLMTIGDTYPMIASAYDIDGNLVLVGENAIQWISEATTVAKIGETDGILTAWTAGEAIIKAYEPESGRYDSTTVTVRNAMRFFGILNWSKGTGIDTPWGIAYAPDGNLYVTDAQANCVNIISTSGQLLNMFGAFGTGDGQFSTPTGIAVDAAGNIFVVDTDNNRVQKFDGDTHAYVTQWGAPGTLPGEFNHPIAIAVDQLGNVFVVDRNNYRVQKFDNSGNYITEWSTTDGQPFYPQGIGTDAEGNVYVSDYSQALEKDFPEDPDAYATFYIYGRHRVQKFTNDGIFLTKWTGKDRENTEGNADIDQPSGLTVDSFGRVYLATMKYDQVEIFTKTGTTLTAAGKYGTAADQCIDPIGVAIDLDGNLYVTNTGNPVITKLLRIP